jgi:hypothetical protein
MVRSSSVPSSEWLDLYFLSMIFEGEGERGLAPRKGGHYL